MTATLQGFMTVDAKPVGNQGCGPWPKWPRRVGARTRPGQNRIRMYTYSTRQHKSADPESCKAASSSCKTPPKPAARIFQNHHTAATTPKSHAARLDTFSRRKNPETPVNSHQHAVFPSRIAGVCKPCRVVGVSRLQDQPARVSCKERGGVAALVPSRPTRRASSAHHVTSRASVRTAASTVAATSRARQPRRGECHEGHYASPVPNLPCERD